VIVLRDYQEEGVEEIRASFRHFDRVCYVLPTGGGKCLARGTPVLMFDGTVRPVEDVQVDDLLMGPDSKPRRVLSLARGTDQMYRVTPKKGAPYSVNSAHILSLKMTAGNKIGFADGAIVNLTVTDYLSRTKTFRHCAKGWRVGVEFPPHSESLAIEPYYLGLWLGDGNTRKPCITTGDPEVVAYLADHARRLGMELRVEPNSQNSQNCYTTGDSLGGMVDRRQGPGTNPLTGALRQYGLIQNKHIPHRYKTGTRQERLEVLAGYLDADGWLHHNFYEISAKCPRLAEDILFLARSLGLAAYVLVGTKTCGNNGVSGEYSRITISGHVDMIPCRIARKKAAPRGQVKDALVHGLAVEPVGEGEYFGFEIDGDRLFLLGDFTVTHNTVTFSFVVQNAVRKGTRVVIIAHRREIVCQISKALTDIGVEHGIVAPGFRGTSALVQVAMVQTLVKRLGAIPTPGLLVIDECHHAAAGSWLKIMEAWKGCKVLGVTATPIRLDKKGLGVAFDDMVCGPTTNELIERGALAPYLYFAPPSDVDMTGLRVVSGDWEAEASDHAVIQSRALGDAVEHYKKYLIGRPALAFCASVAGAEEIAAYFTQAGIPAMSVDGGMKTAERVRRLKMLEDGELMIITSCMIISEGFDVPAVAGAILLRPTMSLSLFLQQIGRSLRPKEGGGCAIILDHVGNVNRHGMPDMERVWTLDGLKGDAEPISQCKLCHVVQSRKDTASPWFECPAGLGERSPGRVPLEMFTDEALNTLTRKQLEVYEGLEAGGMPWREADREKLAERFGFKRNKDICHYLNPPVEQAPRIVQAAPGELEEVTDVRPMNCPAWAGGLSLDARGAQFFQLLDLAGTDPERLAQIQRHRDYKPGWIKYKIAEREAVLAELGEFSGRRIGLEELSEPALWTLLRAMTGWGDNESREMSRKVRVELFTRRKQKAA
jgi:superfamily II DNA or RNA helicase